MKSIHIQTQKFDGGSISPVKNVNFASLSFDNIRVTVNICHPKIREMTDFCTIEVVDDNDVFVLTTEQLFKIIRFYADYAADQDTIIHHRNKYHHIIKDELK